jgi:ubiquinone/menaquinone biosynthesis C-methylase UbiE
MKKSPTAKVDTNQGKQPLNPKTMPTDWGAVADWYDELVGESGSEFHRNVVLPGVLRLLTVGRGQAFLDVACGQGVLCRLMAARGVNCLGVDAAGDLVRIARERAAQRAEKDSGLGEQNYQVADARDLLSLPAERFDAAACVLAIQNIHPIGPVFQGVRRSLKAGGAVVLVMMHPAFRSPKETSWGWDEKGGVQYRRVDKYLVPRKHPIVTHPGKKTGEYTWTFHKPLQDYVEALVKAGLLVDAIEEWPSHKNSTSGPKAAAENTARKEIPMFLAIRAVKVGAAAPAEVAAG